MRPSSRSSERFLLCLLFAALFLAVSLPRASCDDFPRDWKNRLRSALEDFRSGGMTAERWRALLGDPDFGLNYFALTTLPDEDVPALADDLLSLALSSRFPPLRTAAARRLAARLPGRLLEACRPLLERGGEPAALALDALGFLDAPAAADLLARAARSGDELLSTRAFRVLLRRHTPQGLRVLGSIARDSSLAVSVRTQAIGSLRFFHEPQAMKLLFSLLDDPDMEVSDTAWLTLVDLTGRELPPEKAEWERWWESASKTFRWPPSVKMPDVKPVPLDPAVVRRAVDEGCAWLIRHQDADGRFDSLNYSKHDPDRRAGKGRNKTDVCMTALAVLAMLSAGVDGTDPASKARAEAVDKAMKWLVKQQNPPGNYRSDNPVTYVHEQGLATWALAEYVAAGHEDYIPHMQRAFRKCMEYRDGDLAWGYPGMLGNTTNSCVTYWYACAFAAARNAGFELPRAGWEGIADWFDRATEEYSGMIYNASAKEPSPAMTGVGLLVKSFLLWDMADVVQLRSASVLLDRDITRCSYYDLYLYSLGLSRVPIPQAKNFIARIRARLVELQDGSDSHLKGSWDPRNDIWETSRLYTAAMAITALTVPDSKLRCLADPLSPAP